MTCWRGHKSPLPCQVQDDSTTLIQPKPGHGQQQVNKPVGTAQHPQWVRPHPCATQQEHACLSTCPTVPSRNSSSPSLPRVIPCTFSPTLLADNQIEAVLQPAVPSWPGWVTTFCCWTKAASSKDTPASPAPCCPASGRHLVPTGIPCHVCLHGPAHITAVAQCLRATSQARALSTPAITSVHMASSCILNFTTT